ncbi:uncharacterized protein LOC121388751 [Gigantopelta aegis]|uniref:uncharacterized protein LOC121388751 n=1 Tax=Gigantopelta aegis TaxID=1735272 RepID=UPI001B88C7EE|nr:uncharacterized protein LOC121388751 [Gigantopelta aegis]
MLSDSDVQAEEVAEIFDFSENYSFFGNRALINSLVDISEEVKFFQYTPGSSLNGCEFDDGVSSWSQPVSRRKYETNTKPQRKRRPLVDCEKPRAVIRMVSDDYNNNFSSELWKSNVEPGTFRYIPNNGQYRLGKMVREERDWFTVRKKQPEKVTPILQALYVQREIKTLTRNNLELKRSTNTDGESKGTKSVGPEESNEVILRKESDAHLTKSATDLYIENIPSRLDVLEKEIKRDNALVRRTLDFEESAKPHPARSKYREQKAVKECFCASTSSSANSTQDECPPQEGIVIKALGALEKLRPLEKVTPQQRALQDVRNEKIPHKPHVEMTTSVVAAVTSVEECSSTNSVRHEPTNLEDLDPVQLKITSTAAASSQSCTTTGRFENGKGEPTRSNRSKLKSQGAKMSSTFLSTPDMYSTDFDYVRPEGEVCGTKAIISNKQTSRSVPSKNSQCSNLPDISGRRIQISVTSQRLL